LFALPEIKRLYAVVALGVAMLIGAALTKGGFSLVLQGLSILVLVSSVSVFLVLAVFFVYLTKRIQIGSASGFVGLESLAKDYFELVRVVSAEFPAGPSLLKHGLLVEFAHAAGRDGRPLANGIAEGSPLRRQDLTPSNTYPSSDVHRSGA